MLYFIWKRIKYICILFLYITYSQFDFTRNKNIQYFVKINLKMYTLIESENKLITKSEKYFRLKKTFPSYFTSSFTFKIYLTNNLNFFFKDEFTQISYFM